jgi:hypothetical protein
MDAVDMLQRVALKAEAVVKSVRKAPAATPEHAAAPAPAPARRLGDGAVGVVAVGTVVLLPVGSVWQRGAVVETCQQAWAWIQDEWEVLSSGTLRIEDVPSYLARQQSQNRRPDNNPLE